MKGRYQVDCLMWFAEMHGVYVAMPEAERNALDVWERENMGDGVTATSDWPGWAKYLSPPPWKLTDHPAPPPPRRPLPRSLVLAVFKRDGFACRHCGTGENLVVDHVVPLARGGTDELENLQVLCHGCNSRKGAKVNSG